MKFLDASWKPGERWKVYGGTARLDCRVYVRDFDEDAVGRPTQLVGPYEDLDLWVRQMNRLVNQ